MTQQHIEKLVAVLTGSVPADAAASISSRSSIGTANVQSIFHVLNTLIGDNGMLLLDTRDTPRGAPNKFTMAVRDQRNISLGSHVASLLEDGIDIYGQFMRDAQLPTRAAAKSARTVLADWLGGTVLVYPKVAPVTATAAPPMAAVIGDATRRLTMNKVEILATDKFTEGLLITICDVMCRIKHSPYTENAPLIPANYDATELVSRLTTNLYTVTNATNYQTAVANMYDIIAYLIMLTEIGRVDHVARSLPTDGKAPSRDEWNPSRVIGQLLDAVRQPCYDERDKMRAENKRLREELDQLRESRAIELQPDDNRTAGAQIVSISAHGALGGMPRKAELPECTPSLPADGATVLTHTGLADCVFHGAVTINIKTASD